VTRDALLLVGANTREDAIARSALHVITGGRLPARSRWRARVGGRFDHVREIHIPYCGDRRFPPALGAEPTNPGVFVRRERGIQAGCAHSFDRD
jgi:hypothetical protein